MKAVDPLSTSQFVPECDRKLPPEQQTSFEVRPLLNRERKAITNRQNPTYHQETKTVGLGGNAGDITLDAARASIVSWSNLLHPKTGEPVECVRKKLAPAWGGAPIEMVDDPAMEFIPWDVVAEIYAFTMAGCTLNEDDAGNS